MNDQEKRVEVADFVRVKVMERFLSLAVSGGEARFESSTVINELLALVAVIEQSSRNELFIAISRAIVVVLTDDPQETVLNMHEGEGQPLNELLQAVRSFRDERKALIAAAADVALTAKACGDYGGLDEKWLGPIKSLLKAQEAFQESGNGEDPVAQKSK